MDTIELIIENVTMTADGVARKEDGKVLFIPRTLPGERVSAEIISEKKKFGRAEVREVLDPAPDRIPPDCAHFDLCGGCAFWHTSDGLAHKVSAAASTLARIGNYDGDVSVIEAPSEIGWRNRAKFHVVDGVVGFFQRGTHEVFAVEQCLILDPRISSVLDVLKNHIDAGNGTLFVETSGDRAHVTVSGAIANAWKPLASPNISGITVERRKRDDLDISLEIIGQQVKLPSGLFRQGNDAQNEKLIAHVLSFVSEKDVITEYFCGYGNLTFPFSRSVSRVRAFEADEVAIATANRLSEELAVENASFEVRDLFQHVPTFEDSETAVLDPPRAGANRVCETLATTQTVRKVIYVSCDVATLARDIKTLTGGGFAVNEVTFFEFFPKAGHLETVAVLSR